MATIAPNDWETGVRGDDLVFSMGWFPLRGEPRSVTASASYGLVSLDVDPAGAAPIAYFRIAAEHLSGGEADD